MTRLRFRGSATMTLVVALAIIQPAIAQPVSPRPYPSSTSDSADPTYKIYSLDDFGSDPGLCEWIAQTIPEVIAAGTWGNPGVIRYYAPKNLLVVSHSSAVQAQVDNFLKDVKKSLSETTKARASAPKSMYVPREVVQAEYTVPLPKGTKPAPAPAPSISYLVPAQAKAPKHLFHFIIRYEGEGIVDDNIVKAMKDYYRAEIKAAQSAAHAAPPGPPPATNVPGTQRLESAPADAPPAPGVTTEGAPQTIPAGVPSNGTPAPDAPRTLPVQPPSVKATKEKPKEKSEKKDNPTS